MNSILKEVNIVEIVLGVYLFANVIFYPINGDELDYLVPEEIVIYSYWLSVGLFVGFKVCRYQMTRILKKRYQREEQVKKNLPLN